jgi:hypothetical protein
MKFIPIYSLIGLLFTTGAANALALYGEAGEDYTNLGVSLGASDPGMMLNGNWVHNDDRGDIASLGLGLNLPLGPVLFTMGGKMLYLNPYDGDEGYAFALGGGAQLPLGDRFSIFGDAYYSPDSLSSGVKEYVEASTGVRWKLTPLLSVDAGYRYMNMKGKNGNRDDSVADGAYASVKFSF